MDAAPELQLSPPSTTVALKDLSQCSPDDYEFLFGRLHAFRDRFLARWLFGQRTKEGKKQVVRRYALATWDRISSPLKLVIRDTRRTIDKKTGQECTVLHDPIARLDLDELQLLLGPSLYNELLNDHRDSILGVAIQLMHADRQDYESWLHSRAKARPPQRPAFSSLAT